MNQLPEDISRKIWNNYFVTYVVPEIPVWLQVQGCLHEKTLFPSDKNFISRTVTWSSNYLNSFQPLLMRMSKMFCNYIDNYKNKYKWPDNIYIYIDSKYINLYILELQRRYGDGNIEIYKNIIKLNIQPYIEKWISHIMDICEIDMQKFIWQPLNLIVDVEKCKAYFRDSSTCQISDVVYDDNINFLYYEDNIDPIPWFIYVP